MQALLLATDHLQKLAPLTERTPAPLLSVTNRPVMAYPVEVLARSDVKQIMVALANRGSEIASYFGNGRSWGVQFDYFVQRNVCDLADVLRGVTARVHETLLVMPADAVLDLDIEAALAAHQAHGGLVTLILHAQTSADALAVRLNSFGRVQQIGVTSDHEELQFTSACILEPQALEHLAHCDASDDHALFTALMAMDIPIFGHICDGYWNPLDSLEAYQEAQRVFLSNAFGESADLPHVRFPSIEGQQVAPGVWVGRNHAIHPNARLAAPLCIGDSCLIGDDVELGPYAVVGAHSVIDEGATVLRSTVSDRTYVGRLVNLDDRIVERTTIIHPHSAQQIEVVDPFLLSDVALERSQRLQRMLTAALAAMLLVIALPAMIIIGMVVGLTSGGRIFRREQRVGRRALATSAIDPTALHLLLFNTQRGNGSATLFGAWLRHTGLDHVPSLWNVLVGDLNFVGVKPLTLDEAAHLGESWHETRNDAAAGLTGLWFTQTYRNTDIDAVLVADVYYAATRSWKTDLSVMAQTPFAWLRRVRRSSTVAIHTPRQLPRQIV